MNPSDFSEVDLEAIATPEILERGARYLAEGHLLRVFRLGDLLCGVVAGTLADYKVRLWITGPELTGECDCPYPGFCKHLTAVALAWLRSPEQFLDLGTRLEEIGRDPERLRTVFLQMVDRDPAGFAELCGPTGSGVFLESRGLLNLVRTGFSQSGLNFSQPREFRKRLHRIGTMVSERLSAGDSGALPALAELLSRLAEAWRESPVAILSAAIREQLQSAAGLPAQFSRTDLGPLLDLMIDLAIDPGLWELHPEFRSALIPFFQSDPEGFGAILKQKSPGERLVGWMARYELLAACGAHPASAQLLWETGEWLARTDPGRLWLIDRLGETEPERAFRLAREGLAAAADPETQNAYRDGLIRLHWRSGELRQAASLSFVQFRQNPVFEEYLRLRSILADRPVEFQNYRRRIREIIAVAGLEALTLRIAVAERDPGPILAGLGRWTEERALWLDLSEWLGQTVPEPLVAVYEPLIRKLLGLEMPAARKAAMRLLIRYKKYCLSQGEAGEWERLRQALLTEFDGDPRTLRRFGSILNG
jgi:hypothetical protein